MTNIRDESVVLYTILLIQGDCEVVWKKRSPLTRGRGDGEIEDKLNGERSRVEVVSVERGSVYGGKYLSRSERLCAGE